MKNRLLRAGITIAAGLALLGTLALYQRPGFMVQLADQIWSCF